MTLSNAQYALKLTEAQLREGTLRTVVTRAKKCTAVQCSQLNDADVFWHSYLERKHERTWTINRSLLFQQQHLMELVSIGARDLSSVNRLLGGKPL